MVHTNLEAINSPYVTLSHCWGSNPLVKLLIANVEDFSGGIQIEKLPRTFRDAIEVCGWYHRMHIVRMVKRRLTDFRSSLSLGKLCV